MHGEYIYITYRRSSVGTVTELRARQLTNRGSIPDRRFRFFTFFVAFTLAPEPTQPSIQWAPEALSLGLKRPGLEADHSLPSSDEIKNEQS